MPEKAPQRLSERLDAVSVSRKALLTILERYAAGETTVDPESTDALDSLLEAIQR